MHGIRLSSLSRRRAWARKTAVPFVMFALTLPVAAQETPPPEPAAAADLAPSGDTECVRGRSCLLDIRIDNLGTGDFEGAAGLSGIFDPALTVESVSGETRGLDCKGTGEGAYECLGSALTIKPGEPARIQLVVDIPDDLAADTVNHTKTMIWPDAAAKDSSADNDLQVSAISILDPAMLPAVDLSLATAANSENCTTGEDCGFSLTVTNNGPATYDGPIEVSASTDPAAADLATASPSNWKCQGADGQFNCRYPNASLAPGDTQTLALTLTAGLPAGGTLDNCGQVSRGLIGRIAAVQRALNEAGYKAGPVDGISGRMTRGAVSAYQEANDLAATGEIDAELLQLLDITVPGDIDPENDRACASVRVEAAEAFQDMEMDAAEPAEQ